jgi:hypothetical protein
MSRADLWVTIALWACLLVHVVVLIAGLTTHRLSFLTALLNLMVALSIILYWVQKQLRIEYHIFEMREWAALAFEVVVVGSSIYTLVTKQWTGGLRVFLYIFFGIHLFAFLAMVIFAMTFKLKRLF